jgi:hypothetical protein
VQRNQDPEISRRRFVRRQLRALDGQLVHLEHEQWETRTVEDGTETYKDSDGNTRTRTRYSSVKVLMHYHNGTISVVAKEKLPYSRGFTASIHYTDGHGVAVAPHTGQHHNVTGSTSLGMEALGIDKDFNPNGQKYGIMLNDPQNVPKWQQGLVALDQKDREYRADLAQKHQEKEQVLSSAFWVNVYDNDLGGRYQVEQHFQLWETNPKMRLLPVEHRAGLDYVFKRMAYVSSHPCAAYWFTFFDDAWDQNQGMDVMKDKAMAFDPRFSSSLAYTPMKREQLDQKLQELGVRHATKYFSDALLDAFYEKLNEYDEAWRNGGRLPGAPVPNPMQLALAQQPSQQAAI